MSPPTINLQSSCDPDLDVSRLCEPEYFEERRAYFAKRSAQHLSDSLARWYVVIHTHTCKVCQRVIAHTGLEAKRDGFEAHLCCGKDVRLS